MVLDLVTGRVGVEVPGWGVELPIVVDVVAVSLAAFRSQFKQRIVT